MSDIWKPKVVVLRDQHGESIYHQANPDKADEETENEKSPVRFDFHFHGNYPPSDPPKANPKSKWDIAKRVGETILVLAGAWGAWCIYWQLDANKRQAAAAESQLSEMRKEQKIDVRPWVLTSRQVQTNSGETGIWRVFYHNVGKTPALNVQCVSQTITNLNDLLPGGISLRTNEQISDMLAPTGGEDLNVDILMTPPFIVFMTNGGTVFGACQIVYDDIFGAHHWTRNTWGMRGHYVESNKLEVVSMFPQKGNDCDTND